MIYSNELFLLINSLTKTEKKYFKGHTLNTGGNKDYIKVFDAINRQTKTESVYNEDLLRSKIKDIKIIRNLSAIKNYLYNSILSALINYSARTTLKYKVSRLIDSIEMLSDKGLYKSALKLIKSTRKLIIKDHMLEYELMLNNLEMALSRRLGYSNLKPVQLKEKRMANRELINKSANHIEYRYITAQFYYMLNKQGAPDTPGELKYFDTLMKDPLLKDHTKAVSISSLKDFYDLTAHYCLLKNDFEGSLINLKETIKIYDKNPVLKYQTFLHYFSVVHNMLLALLRLKRFDEAEKFLSELKLELKNKKLRKNELLKMRFVNLFQIELMVYYRLGNFHKMKNIAEEINITLEKYRNKLGPLLKFSLIYHTACCYFGMEKYTEALEWINRLVRKDEEDFPADYLITANILKLMIHYELKDYNFLGYFTISLQNLMVKSRHEKFIEYLINKAVRKIVIKENENEEIKHIFRNLLEKHGSMPTVHNNLSIDLQAWIRGKCESKSYSEVIKNNK
jgi:tetratricopeptide (TPR) repeat protein